MREHLGVLLPFVYLVLLFLVHADGGYIRRGRPPKSMSTTMGVGGVPAMEFDTLSRRDGAAPKHQKRRKTPSVCNDKDASVATMETRKKLQKVKQGRVVKVSAVATNDGTLASTGGQTGTKDELRLMERGTDDAATLGNDAANGTRDAGQGDRRCKVHEEGGAGTMQNRLRVFVRARSWGSRGPETTHGVDEEQGRPASRVYRAKKCSEASCYKRPTYGKPLDRKALRCQRHREQGDEDVVNRRCSKAGCQNRAGWGGKDTGWGASFCRHHKAKDHRSIVRKGIPRHDSWMHGPTVGVCGTRGCRAAATWADTGSDKATSCRDHREVNQISIYKMSCDWPGGCSRRAFYGTPGEMLSRRCAIHCGEKDVDLKHRPCLDSACRKAACYGLWEGGPPLFCASHRSQEHVTPSQRAASLARWAGTLAPERRAQLLRECFEGKLDWAQLPPEARPVATPARPMPPRGLAFLRRSLLAVPESDMLSFLETGRGAALANLGWVPSLDLAMDVPWLSFTPTPPRVFVRHLGQETRKRVS